MSLPSAPLTMPTSIITTPGTVEGFSKSAFARRGRTFTVTVSWLPPSNDGGAEVIGYVSRVGTGRSWSAWTDLDEPSTFISGMRPWTRYTVQVQAVNFEGFGTLSSYTFTTPRR